LFPSLEKEKQKRDYIDKYDRYINKESINEKRVNEKK
jgi:hypothetical protein